MSSQTLNMNFILIRKQMSLGIRLHEKCFCLCYANGAWQVVQTLAQCLDDSHTLNWVLNPLFLGSLNLSRWGTFWETSIKKTLDTHLHCFNWDQGPCEMQQWNVLANSPSSSCREIKSLSQHFPLILYFNWS